ncbi:E3 ubiquitin-protein ligase TRIM33-like, partial [Mercenaria mercenaria]|uniref:E3 ubiquitin-protein ligase TRIM33-like n=1 Tax=Mercenaria mercenaria TaxID=6596 RepID=UPI00234F3716
MTSKSNMEVSGRKDCNKQDKLCKPCEDRELATGADGFCMECEEYMCQTCFDSHKQWKICRGHTMTSSEGSMVTKERRDDFEKCNQHLNEFIKFYCPEHEQVGCGDCMILEHKTCKVEYIRDKASMFKESKDFIDLVKGAEKCHIEAKEVASSIRNNKIQVVDINRKFSGDVEMFKEEMFSHITKQTNAMLKKGEDVKATDMKKMDKLKNENEGLIDEISLLSELFNSLIDTPNKLFARSILQKPKLIRLREQLNNIKERNKITVYEFKRDGNLERSVKDCKQLGNIQTNRQINKTDFQDEVRPKKTAQLGQDPVLPKYQPLLDRQLMHRNITVDGEYL